MDIAYLDNAATTRVCSEAAQAALRVMTEVYGNPSSTHTLGREARAVLETARKNVAAALGCQSTELTFTSGGSESNNWAIRMGAEAMRRHGKHIITSAVEHDSVRKTCDALEALGWRVTRLSPELDGSITSEQVLQALQKDTALVTLMMVNNETGAVTDIAAIARALKKAGSKALLHTDAVQGFMKVPFSVKTLGADLISVSGHKIHAPKGVGALYIRSGLRLQPLIAGGAQENGRRAGTEGLPQIAAFGEAAAVAKTQLASSLPYMAQLREKAAQRLQNENEGLLVIGGGAPHILSISLPGYKSEVIMNFLEAKDIFVSKSSACKKGARSHVLEAMGLPNPVIDGAVRISLSRYTTEADIDRLCTGVKEAREKLYTVLK